MQRDENAIEPECVAELAAGGKPHGKVSHGAFGLFPVWAKVYVTIYLQKACPDLHALSWGELILHVA